MTGCPILDSRLHREAGWGIVCGSKRPLSSEPARTCHPDSELAEGEGPASAVAFAFLVVILEEDLLLSLPSVPSARPIPAQGGPLGFGYMGTSAVDSIHAK
jgi:hypothetical protein